MTLTHTQIEELARPLDGKHVKKKPTGFAASYIEGWHAIAEANRIFGHDGWHRETFELRLVGEYEEKDNKGVLKWKIGYLARVKITVTGGEDKLDICREGVGFGNDHNKSRVDAHELAAKEAETDATKRALMTFGWPFGLALYDKTQEHVDRGNGNLTNTEKTLADGIHGGDDFLDQEAKPSKQAVEIGNLFVKCASMTELRAEMDKQKHTISALHPVDKNYLKYVCEDCIRSKQARTK